MAIDIISELKLLGNRAVFILVQQDYMAISRYRVYSCAWVTETSIPRFTAESSIYGRLKKWGF